MKELHLKRNPTVWAAIKGQPEWDSMSAWRVSLNGIRCQPDSVSPNNWWLCWQQHWLRGNWLGLNLNLRLTWSWGTTLSAIDSVDDLAARHIRLFFFSLLNLMIGRRWSSSPVSSSLAHDLQDPWASLRNWTAGNTLQLSLLHLQGLWASTRWIFFRSIELNESPSLDQL